MKKITIVIILILVAASFLLYLNKIGNAQDNVSFTAEPDSVAFSAPEQTVPQETVQANLSDGQPEEISDVQADVGLGPAVSKARISDDKYYYSGNSMAFRGTVVDSQTGEPLQGLNVVEFCDGKAITDNADVTSNDGSFDFDVSMKCANGHMHKVMVEYNGIQSFTDEVTLMRKPVKRVSGGSSILKNVPSSGVPEFSTITLALVILGGSLGLAILRKD